jgi:hypothetical protein
MWVCCRYVSNDLMYARSRFLNLIMVSNRLQKVASQLHVVEGILCGWMRGVFIYDDSLSVRQCLERFLGMIGPNRSVPKSSRLQVVIFRVFSII